MSVRTVAAPSLPEGYVSFRHRRDQRALVGTWAARVLLPEGAEPKIGEEWTVPGIMVGGILTQATKEGQEDSASNRNLWSLAGYDGGFRLMQSPPLPHQLSSTSLGGVIQEIARSCGVEVEITLSGNLPIDARYLVSGQTAANAILDLALLGGAVAFVVPEGKEGAPFIRVAPPRSCLSLPLNGLALERGDAKNLDLDGFASGVVVVLGRRGKTSPATKGNDEDGDGGSWYSAKTPLGMLHRISRSGSTALPGGSSLLWSYTLLDPIGVVAEYRAVLNMPGAGISKVIAATYDYDVRTAVVRAGDQEQRLWRYGLLRAESVESTSVNVVYYDAAVGAPATERVERTMSFRLKREYDADLAHVFREETESRVFDPGAAKVQGQQPFDSRSERAWTWDDANGYRGLVERIWTYEERDAGVADTVLAPTGEATTFTLSDGRTAYVRLPGYQTTVRVRREQIRQTDEIIDESGFVASRIERETDDEGIADMLARGLFGDTRDATNQDVKAAMAWLRSLPQRGSLRVYQAPGSSVITEEVGTLAQPGRRHRTTTGRPISATRYTEWSWRQPVCPFLLSDLSCGILQDSSSASFASSGVSGSPAGWSGGGVETPRGSAPSWEVNAPKEDRAFEQRPCVKLEGETTPDYESCARYRSFRHLAGQATRTDPASPVVGIAGDGAVWTEKEVYLDQDLPDGQALFVAQTMAQNILAVKTMSRGIIVTATIPINTKLQPDGAILAVEHDWEQLRTQVSYRPSDATPPEWLMLLSTSATAANVYARENVGKGRSAIGRVVDVRPDQVTAIIGGRPVSCTSSVRVLRGDNALIFFPPGAVSSGIVQAVL